MTRTVCTLLMLVAISSVASPIIESPTDISTLIHQAEAKGLENHPYWKALMHYRRAAKDHENLISDVISPLFFLSDKGATDSAAELAGTLLAFFEDPDKDPDNHPQCRFIARYKWLRESLDWGMLKPPPVICKRFEKWSLHGQIDSLSLVFVAGYFGNPASYYGHILLKFNSRTTITSSGLLDQSMNFGAIVPENENGLVYVLKGLFGGYDAGFSHTQFYRHNHIYVENELRDMWEYELALTKGEIDRIVSHSWELLGNKFVYYFLRENCAYRMAELLELVIEQPLLSRNLPWSIPATVFDRLVTIEKNGTPMVRKVRWIPSRQNRFHTKFSALNDTQRVLAEELVDNSLNLELLRYQELPNKDKVVIVDTLLDYYEFRIIAENKDDLFKQAKHKLLIERTALPEQSPAMIKVRSDAPPPHNGPLPGMTALGLIHNNEFGYGIELRLRPAYYDILGLNAGRLANSNLTMFDLRVIYNDNRIWFRSLDFVNVETLGVARTHLPGDGGLAWKVKFGLESQNLECRNCVIFSVFGGLGKAASITRRMVVYGMLDVHAQTAHRNSGHLGATVRAGLLGSPVTGWKLYISVGHRTYLNGGGSGIPIIRWENRFGNNRNWNVSISFEENVGQEFKTAVSFYW